MTAADEATIERARRVLDSTELLEIAPIVGTIRMVARDAIVLVAEVTAERSARQEIQRRHTALLSRIGKAAEDACVKAAPDG